MSPVEGYYKIHYLYDYSHGFVARGLVGEILSKLFNTITPNITKWTVFVFSCLLIVFTSLCIGKALNMAKKNGTYLQVLFIIILICFSPVAFKAYLMDIKLDKILWFVTLAAVLLSGKKWGIWFTPLLCFTATLVNPVYLFCSMILIALILLQKFHDSKFSIKNGIICFISYAGMIAIGIYGVWSEKKLGFATPTEMVNYYFSNYSVPIDAGDLEQFKTEWLFDYFEPIKKCFQMAYQIYFVKWGYGSMVIANFLLVALPIFVALGIIWIKAIKSTDDKFQKFIFFLCMISPIVTIPPVLISWEGSKYFGNIILVQLCMMIWYLIHDNGAFIGVAKKVEEFLRKNFMLTLLAFGYIGFLFYGILG